MSGPGRRYHGPGPSLEPAVALGGYALAVACFFSIGMLIGGGPLPSTIAQVVALAGVPLLLVRLHGGGRADLGLVTPPLLPMVGAVLAGAGIWLIALRLAQPVVRATDAGPAMRELSRTLLADDIAIVLLVRALVPALCEELLHRGLLLSALAPRLGRGLAVIVTAALFALIHLEPARMVSASLIGLLAGTLAVWSRSVGPAIALHAVNNAAALLVGMGGWPALNRAIGGRPDLALAVACGLVGAGIGLAWAGRQRS